MIQIKKTNSFNKKVTDYLELITKKKYEGVEELLGVWKDTEFGPHFIFTSGDITGIQIALKEKKDVLKLIDKIFLTERKNVFRIILNKNYKKLI